MLHIAICTDFRQSRNTCIYMLAAGHLRWDLSSPCCDLSCLLGRPAKFTPLFLLIVPALHVYSSAIPSVIYYILNKRVRRFFQVIILSTSLEGKMILRHFDPLLVLIYLFPKIKNQIIPNTLGRQSLDIGLKLWLCALLWIFKSPSFHIEHFSVSGEDSEINSWFL
jgi:hypothetical protein